MDFSLDTSFELDPEPDHWHHHSPLSATSHLSMEHHHDFDETGAPIRKRKRTTRACDRCRMKKSKCDGLTPCGRCKLDDVVCVFGEQNHGSREESLHDKHIHLLESQNRSLSTGLLALLSAAQAGKISHIPPASTLSANEILEFLHPHTQSPQERGYTPRNSTTASHKQQHTSTQHHHQHGQQRPAPRSQPSSSASSELSQSSNRESHPPSPTHSASSRSSGLATPEFSTLPDFPAFPTGAPSFPGASFPAAENPQLSALFSPPLAHNLNGLRNGLSSDSSTPSLSLSSSSFDSTPFPGSTNNHFNGLKLDPVDAGNTADLSFWDPTLLPNSDLASYGFGLFDEPGAMDLGGLFADQATQGTMGGLDNTWSSSSPAAAAFGLGKSSAGWDGSLTTPVA